ACNCASATFRFPSLSATKPERNAVSNWPAKKSKNSSDTTASELEPQLELDVPLRAGRRVQDLAEIAVAPQRLRILQTVAGNIEDRRVREIEGFGAELHLPVFVDGEVFKYREVGGARRRPGLALQAEIAVRQRCGNSHAGDVEPLRGIPAIRRRGIWTL